MQMHIDQLRAVTTLLYDELATVNGGVVDIPDVLYWSIPLEERRDPYKHPRDLTIGHTSDDVGHLNAILTGEHEPIRYALVWLAAVLREVGEGA